VTLAQELHRPRAFFPPHSAPIRHPAAIVAPSARLKLHSGNSKVES